MQGQGRPLGTVGWGWGGDGEQGAGYQLLWAPVPRVFWKAKEILESTCQRLAYFRTQIMSGQVQGKLRNASFLSKAAS